MRQHIRPALVSFVLLTLITGVVYPLVVTAVARTLYPRQATGSIIERDGRPIGSELIGQWFTEPKYLWPRPSATSPNPYTGDAGSGSNLAVTNPAQVDAMKQREATLRAADPGNDKPIPIDLLTASGSGLDPHISPEAAAYQVDRVARARGVSRDAIQACIASCTEGRTFGVLGEARVNVLKLNLLLDQPGLAAMHLASTQSSSEPVELYRARGFYPR